MVASEFSGMLKLVQQIHSRQDAEPFREPVDWKSLALFDYPQIIKKPMDLSQVKRNIEIGKYSNINEAAEDVRLIWTNCMQYNADGSDFYVLAQNFQKSFESKYNKLVKEQGSIKTEGKGKNMTEPTLDEKKSFAKSLYKISKEELGILITTLDEKCPAALTKNASEDEVEINVDNIVPAIFHELTAYVRNCSSDSASGRKKKSSGGKSNLSKKSRTS